MTMEAVATSKTKERKDSDIVKNLMQ